MEPSYFKIIIKITSLANLAQSELTVISDLAVFGT